MWWLVQNKYDVMMAVEWDKYCQQVEGELLLSLAEEEAEEEAEVMAAMVVAMVTRDRSKLNTYGLLAQGTF